MTRNLKLTILGSGCSFGVPYAGNSWGECDPNEPKNKRSRCALLVESDTTTVVIDTGQDFREQMNKHNVQNVDAVLYTHKHPDHTAGIDDLRIYSIRKGKQPLPAYMDQTTYDYLSIAKDYLIEEQHETYPSVLVPHILAPLEKIKIGDIDITTHTLDHGTITSTGYRFGNTAYSLDMKSIPEEKSLQSLIGIDTWIVDAGAYREKNFSVHANFDEVIALNQKIKAERVIFMSLSNKIDYQTVSKELPNGYELAYDGMII
ncbi:MAG: MBL fold metallo-hydrolase [Bdellovibrionales bacterium]